MVGFADGQSYNLVLPSPQYQRFFGKRGDPAIESIVLSFTDLFLDQIITVVVLFPLFDKVEFQWTRDSWFFYKDFTQVLIEICLRFDTFLRMRIRKFSG